VKTRPPVERVHPPHALLRMINPLMRRLIARGRFGHQLLLLHYVGRRSGRRFDVPAGYSVIDGVVSVLTSSGWRHNFAGGRDIEVTMHGRRRPAHAVLIDDPHEVTDVYMRLIDELGINKHVVVWDFDSTSIGYRLDRSCKRPFSSQASPSYESMIKNRRSE
jgi:hypothetical protein